MKLKPYKIHLVIGLFFLPILILSSLTGFFRANHKWFWKEDYMKVKRVNYSNRLTAPLITFDELEKKSDSFFNKDVEIEQLKLKSEVGKLLYELKIKDNHNLLIDAQNGEVFTPLKQEFALKIASQYIASDLPVKQVEQISNYLPRKQKKTRPVYSIAYNDELNTEIIIDANTGEIVEELDDNLRFGMWMVKLHDYDFGNLKRFNLSFVGIGLTILGLSGFYLWIRKKRKKGIKHRPINSLKRIMVLQNSLKN